LELLIEIGVRLTFKSTMASFEVTVDTGITVIIVHSALVKLPDKASHDKPLVLGGGRGVVRVGTREAEPESPEGGMG
jgi:hypothetical protein